MSKKVLLKDVFKNAENYTTTMVYKIENILSGVKKIPENIARISEKNILSEEDINVVLKSIVDYNDEIYGSTIAFEPAQFKKDIPYYAPYFYKSKEGIQYSDLAKSSYQYVDWDWYKEPKQNGGSVWSEPYFDKGGGNVVMVTYSAPFYRPEQPESKVFRGVVTIDISLEKLQNIISSTKLFKNDYAFLISKQGLFITHPIKELVMKANGNNLMGNTALSVRQKKLVEKLLAGEKGYMKINDIVYNKKSWIFYSPLPSTGWVLGVVFSEGDLFSDLNRLYQIIVIIGISGLIILTLLFLLILRTIYYPLQELKEDSEAFDFNQENSSENNL